MKTAPDTFAADRIAQKIADVRRELLALEIVIEAMREDRVHEISVSSGGAMDDAAMKVLRFASAAKRGFLEARKAKENCDDGEHCVAAAPAGRRKK